MLTRLLCCPGVSVMQAARVYPSSAGSAAGAAWTSHVSRRATLGPHNRLVRRLLAARSRRAAHRLRGCPMAYDPSHCNCNTLKDVE